MKRNYLLFLSLLLSTNTIAQNGQSKRVFVDLRDNKEYNWVKIGEQIWMAENLNYKTTDSYCYDDNESNCNKYGRLYIWPVAKNACPSGWHLSTDNEWKSLEKYARSKQAGIDDPGRTVSKDLKAKTGWNIGKGTDKYGFAALPGGCRNYNGHYILGDDHGYWWSATEIDVAHAGSLALTFLDTNVYMEGSDKKIVFPFVV